LMKILWNKKIMININIGIKIRIFSKCKWPKCHKI